MYEASPILQPSTPPMLTFDLSLPKPQSSFVYYSMNSVPHAFACCSVKLGVSKQR